MEEGQIILCKIFGIKNSDGLEKVKNDLLKEFKQLCQLDITINDFKKIFRLLLENKDYDKANDYIEKIVNQDKILPFKSLHDLIAMLKPDLEQATQTQQKLKDLNPFITFLSQCNKNLKNDIKEIIRQTNELQSDNCKVKSLIYVDSKNTDIKKLLNIDIAYTLPSNVFYRFSIKKSFEDNEINSLNSLIANIKDVKKNTKNKIDIDFLKEMKVQEFKEEIIIKAQDLMKEEKSQYANYESSISSLVYERIESNYHEFGKLSEKDKEFLHSSIVCIIHYDDFERLGQFFNFYFENKYADLEDIKCFTSPFDKDNSSITKFREFSNFLQKKCKRIFIL